MKTHTLIFTLLGIAILLSCQSKQALNNNFLKGKWKTSTAHYDTDSVLIFKKHLRMDFMDALHVEFTKDSLYMDAAPPQYYQLATKDSSLTTYNKEASEVIMLHILNNNEFETTDNMGLTLRFKRIKK